VIGSEATTKHKVTLDPICTPPAREESLDGQARCLRLGSLCWWVGSVLVRYGGCVGRDSGNNDPCGRREHALDFLEVLDFIFPLIYHRV